MAAVVTTDFTHSSSDHLVPLSTYEPCKVEVAGQEQANRHHKGVQPGPGPLLPPGGID